MQQELKKLHMYAHKLFIFMSSKLGVSQFVLIN